MLKGKIVKCFYTQENIGSAKYVVNFHNGNKQHDDGNDFYDIKIFKNKKKFNDFQKELKVEGYLEVYSNFEISVRNIQKYYEYFNNKDLERYSEILDTLFKDRKSFIVVALLGDDIADFSKSSQLHSNHYKQTNSLKGYITGFSYFGIRDTLKPLIEYVAELKNAQKLITVN